MAALRHGVLAVVPTGLAAAQVIAAAMLCFRLAFAKPAIVLTHSPLTCSVMRFAGASAVVASAVLAGRAGLFPASAAVAPGCGVITVAFVVLAVNAASSVVAAGAGLPGTSAFIAEQSVAMLAGTPALVAVALLCFQFLLCHHSFEADSVDGTNASISVSFGTLHCCLVFDALLSPL